MIKKTTTFTSIIFVLLLAAGCTSERPAEYYDTVAARTNALVKLSRKKLDIFNLRMEAELFKAIDVTNLDTARQIGFTEIGYPDSVMDSLFSVNVDFLDFNNFVNAIKNFLSQSKRVELPLYYNVNDNLSLKYQRDEGLILNENSDSALRISSASTEDFLVFLMGLPILAEQDTIPCYQVKADSVNSIKAVDQKKISRQFSLKSLQLISRTFKSEPIKRSNRLQVQVIFNVYNPNLNDCEFNATFSLNSEAGNTIYSFKSEGLVIASRKQTKFVSGCNLSEFEVKRISEVQIQITNTVQKKKI